MDILKRLRAGFMGEHVLKEAADEIERLRTALRYIAEKDFPVVVGEKFRKDMIPSKNDKCIHGLFMYEDCESCISDYATKVLEAGNGYC